MAEVSKCILCKSNLPTSDTLKCPVCQSTQTKFDVWKSSNLYKSIKLIITAIFIPIVLWWISTSYANTQQALADKEKKIAEISSITPLLKNSRINLYSTCLNMSKTKCVEKLSNNINLFTATVSNVQEKVSIHKPDLVPSILVLSTLDVEDEVSSIWNDYFVCIDKTSNEILCNSKRKKRPLMQLEVADFMINYIECDLQQEIIKLKGGQVSNYCSQTISYREKLAKELPNEIMVNYSGFRLPKELFSIKNKIIEDVILPGSGLTVTKNGKSITY